MAPPNRAMPSEDFICVWCGLPIEPVATYDSGVEWVHAETDTDLCAADD